MAAKLFYSVIFVLAALQFVSCQSISCYDCDPANFASDCGDPAGNAVRSTPCTPDLDVANGTAICVSAYLKVTGGTTNMTGIYRGCRTLSPTVGDFCDWFKEERQGINTTVISCVACNTTRCNTIGFRDDGTSGVQGVSATSHFILLFNIVLVLLFASKV